MSQYALIKNGIVKNVIVADAEFIEFIRSEWDAIEPVGETNAAIGWLWDGQQMSKPSEGETPAPAGLPKIHIIAISAGLHAGQTTVAADFAEVTTVAGAVLEITAELRADANVLPLDDEFKMPVTSTDGRERVVLASMVQGVISISVPMNDSRIWKISKETINKELPNHLHMDFDGVTVYVLESVP